MKSKVFFALIKKTLLFFCVFALSVCFFGCSVDSLPYEKTDYLMNTVVTQKLYGSKSAEKTAEKAADLIQKWDERFSAFDEKSELYKINQSGKTVFASEQMIEILGQALQISQIKGDGFDISVLPLSRLWKEAISKEKLPTKEQIEKALKLVDDSKINVDRKNLSVTLKNDAEVDLGALLKGAVLSKIEEIYKENNVSGAICSIGSSAMMIFGSKGGEPFKIGLRAPFEKESESFATLSLKNCVISTSGGYERFFEINGKTYHHIIDTKTGYPSESDIASVTVVSNDGMFSDYLSTMLFMKSFDDAVKEAQKNSFDVVIVSKDKKVFVSSSLEQNIEIIAKDYERVDVK